MPDLADRTEREARLAAKVDEIFAIAREEDRDAIDWQAWEDALAAALDEELAAVFLIVFFLMLSDSLDGILTSEDAIGRFGDPRRGATVAADVGTRSRSLLDAGKTRDFVFGSGRAQAIAVSEVTRSVSEGETAARLVNEAERRRRERDPEAAGRPATPDELEREAPWVDPAAPLRIAATERVFWITARDGAVCSICGPLDGREYDDWRSYFPSGPPAHPFCRCFLRYVNVGTP